MPQTSRGKVLRPLDTQRSQQCRQGIVAFKSQGERRVQLSNQIKFKPLSRSQKIGWVVTSFVYGLCVVAIGISEPLSTSWGESHFVGLLVCWLIGVALLRVYLQDKDVTSFRSLTGLRSDRT
jgi:hypothetical protein